MKIRLRQKNLNQPMNSSILNISTDGGARGNPGPAAIGVVIKDSQSRLIHQFGRTIGIATNNIAEYQAVISALKWLIKNKPKFAPAPLCRFYLDSTLVVNQLNGLWKVKNANLRQKVIAIRQLEAELGWPIKYTAVSRQKNTQADTLLNRALDEQAPTE
jgi:ribonuclease HI